MDLVRILYVAWFVLPMALYISFGPVLLLYMGFGPDDRKHFLKRMAAVIFIMLFLFYVAIPVPQSVQGQFIKDVNNLVDNNSDVSLNHIKLAQSKYCQFPYLSAIVYFQFKRAYLDDFDDTFQRQRGVSGGPIGDSRIAPASEICKTDFM